MTRRDKRPAEESFTLQFGEPDEGGGTGEVYSSDNVVIDDHFMWNNTTAFLEDAKNGAAASDDGADRETDSKDQDISQVEKPDEKVAIVSFAGSEPIKIEQSNNSGFNDADEHIFEEENTPSTVSANPEPELEDDPEPQVLDERQMAMVSSRDVEQPEAPVPSPDEIRLDPAAAVTPRTDVPSFVNQISDDPAKPALFADEMTMTRPIIPPVNQGTKAPWVLYGTLGLGIAVVSLAGIGMVLQMDGSESTEPSVAVAVLEQTPADQEQSPTVEAPEIDVQMKVFRLAVGPFVDNDSHLSRSQIDNTPEHVAPLRLAVAGPDQDFAADLFVSLPISLGTESNGNFGGADEADAVVTLSAERIEIDLTDDVTASLGEGLSSTVSAATTAIDPTIEASDAPELASVISSSEVSPLDGIASRALFDDISQISKELTELEITTIGQSLSLSGGTLGPFEIPKAEVAHELAQPVIVSGFNLESETRVEFTVPNLPVAPLAAVRLASASVGISPVDGEFDAILDSISSLPGPILGEPSRITGVLLPEPNLPKPQIDVSGALTLAAKAAEAEAARLRAAEAELARKKAEAEEAARLAAAAADAVRSNSVVVASVAQAVEETPVIEENVRSDVVPVTQTIAPETDIWVSQAAWIPELGFSVSPVSHDGQTVLEISDIQDGSVLPEWVTLGTMILSVNNAVVESEDAFLRALQTNAKGAEQGKISAFLTLRIRAGLDPREARITAPVWRKLKLGSGSELSVQLSGGKWVSSVLASDENDATGLKSGDILLRDFMTKSNLRSPLALEDLFAKMTEAGERRVDFAILRDGELASGGVDLGE